MPHPGVYKSMRTETPESMNTVESVNGLSFRLEGVYSVLAGCNEEAPSLLEMSDCILHISNTQPHHDCIHWRGVNVC